MSDYDILMILFLCTNFIWFIVCYFLNKHCSYLERDLLFLRAENRSLKHKLEFYD